MTLVHQTRGSLLTWFPRWDPGCRVALVLGIRVAILWILWTDQLCRVAGGPLLSDSLSPDTDARRNYPSDSALPWSSAVPASPVWPWRRPRSPRALVSRLCAAVPLSCSFRSLTSEGCLYSMITLPLCPGDGAGESCFVAALQGSEQTVWAWLGCRLRLGHRCGLGVGSGVGGGDRGVGP